MLSPSLELGCDESRGLLWAADCDPLFRPAVSKEARDSGKARGLGKFWDSAGDTPYAIAEDGREMLRRTGAQIQRRRCGSHRVAASLREPGRYQHRVHASCNQCCR